MTHPIRKRYSNGEVSILWQPDVCIHSGICFRGLPGVFDPSRRPWIDMAAGETEAIMAQVSRCPSGALSIVPNAPQTDAPES